MPITLPDQTRTDLIHSIKRYFLEERDEEMGDLQAGFLLDFVIKEIGPSIYNQAIRDAQRRFQDAVTDLDITLHEPEFGYSAERQGRK
jgi:uncharacterized protein (DUF2164 family)